MATRANDVIVSKDFAGLMVLPQDDAQAVAVKVGRRPNRAWSPQVDDVPRATYEHESHSGAWLAFMQRQQEAFDEGQVYKKASERTQHIRRESAKVGYYAAVKAIMVPSIISRPFIDHHAVANAARIEELRLDAAEEGEPFSPESAAGLIRFCALIGAAQQPAIFLLANGNLRAIWEDDRGQVGLQFLPDGMIQYVILQRQAGSPRSLGMHEPDTVRRIAEAAGVSHLWSRGEG